jgi:hypothetical protein
MVKKGRFSKDGIFGTEVGRKGFMGANLRG